MSQTFRKTMKDRTKKEIAQMKMNTLGRYIQELSAKLTESDQKSDEQARHNRILRRVVWGLAFVIAVETAYIIWGIK